MEHHPVVWGIDIGHTSVKAVKLERQGGQVTVQGYAIEPISVAGDDSRDAAIVNALTALVAREEIRSTPVVVALSGRQVLARTINVPMLNPKRLDRMVELEARQQIPGDFDDVRWGYHMTPGLDGVSNDIALFAVRKEIIEDLIDKCKQAGITLSGVSVSSLAAYNFVQFDQEFTADETVIVLDVGAENTDLVVYQGETLWMRTLSVAGNDVTRNFQKKLKVSFEEAEKLKCSAGDAKQADRIIKVVEGSLSELTSDVQRSLGFYKSKNAEANFESVVVSGNTFRLPGLTQFVADRLGYGIIELIELERIVVAEGMDHDHFLDDLQSLGVAMGLGLQGVGLGKADVNLLPNDLRLQAMLRQKRWAMIAILLIIPLAFAATQTIRQQRLDENVRVAQKIEARIERNTEAQGDAGEVSKQIRPLAEKVLEYQYFGGHVGVINQAERAIISAIQSIANEKELLGGTVPGDLMRGEDPGPQVCYFESMEIIDQEDVDLRSGNKSQDLNPFKPTAVGQGRGTNAKSEPRLVTFTISVPGHADRNGVKLELQRTLEGVTLDRDVATARGIDADDEDKLMDARLFSRIEIHSEQDGKDLEWEYHDPYHRNEETGVLDPLTKELSIPVVIITFHCMLAE